MNDLTVSKIERQNVLNNKYALAKVQENLGIIGMEFEGEFFFTRRFPANFYQINVERMIEL